MLKGKTQTPHSLTRMSSGLKAAALGASLIMLSACATTTPYQQASKAGAFDGYSETLIENDRARVSFGGNSLTDLETVENYLIYRTAEFTKERGYDYFTLIDSDLETDIRLRSRGSSFNRFGSNGFGRSGFSGSRFQTVGFGHRGFGNRGFSRRGFGRSGFGFGFNRFNNFDVREVKKYRAIAEVKLGKGPTPEDERSFDASEVIENLGPSIKYPDEGKAQAVTPETAANKI